MIILAMQSKHVYHVVDHGDAASQDGRLQGQTTENGFTADRNHSSTKHGQTTETIGITTDMITCAGLHVHSIESHVQSLL